MSIYVITGKPRQGKTYWLASNIPRWLYELAEDQKFYDVKDTDRHKPEENPIGCIYVNFKVNCGKGALKNYPERIIGNLHNPDDLANPTKLIFPWYYIQEWNLMNRRGRIIATEAQKYLNSRKWAQLSEETEMKLQMHGHDGLNCYLDLQRFGSIDVIVRDSTELVAVVTMSIGDPDRKGALSIPGIPWVMKRSQIVWIDPELYERYHSLKNNINPKTGTFYNLDELNFEVVDHQSFWHRKDVYAIYNTHEKPVTYTLQESSIPHEVKWCIDDDCPIHGKNKGKPIIHGRTFKEHMEIEGKFI